MGWAPITTAAQVQNLVRDGGWEDASVDFKRKLGGATDNKVAGREACKDVAAFLNGMGGTILVGIDESEGSTASAVVGVDDLDSAREKLAGWLRDGLRPASACACVNPLPIRVGDLTVLAVNVSPWPHGVVAVEWAGSPFPWRFPVRRDHTTGDLTIEEVLMRSDAAGRANHIKLATWLSAHSQLSVHVGSPFAVRMMDRTEILPAPRGAFHGTAMRVDEDVLVLRLRCTLAAKRRYAHAWLAYVGDRAARLGFTVDDVKRMEEWAGTAVEDTVTAAGWSHGGWSDEATQEHEVPLDLIRSCWLRRTTNGPLLCVLLDATIEFDGANWMTVSSRA